MTNKELLNKLRDIWVDLYHLEKEAKEIDKEVYNMLYEADMLINSASCKLHPKDGEV